MDVKVCDQDMLATALRLRDTEHLSLREIASRLVIRTGKKRGRHPPPAAFMRICASTTGTPRRTKPATLPGTGFPVFRCPTIGPKATGGLLVT
ncbi:hypothetical protein ACFRSX_37160 [Streptomyces goshikiensis]|uniref:hypothetical protein n=1 Tax=Streptomyces TaxID=1883 RepID=UPI001F1D79E6|nr:MULTISPECIES: hypothetical protein [unclassified Streptomyces]